MVLGVLLLQRGVPETCDSMESHRWVYSTLHAPWLREVITGKESAVLGVRNVEVWPFSCVGAT